MSKLGYGVTMKKVFNKAVHIYKNQGFDVLTKKAVRFGKTKVRENTRGLDGLFRRLDKSSRLTRDEYSFVSNKIFSVTDQDIELSKQTNDQQLKEIKTANWFIPNFDHLAFGGIQTIFRFIQKFSKEGVHNRIIIYDKPSFDVEKLQKQIATQFPQLHNYEIVIFDASLEDVNDLPACDIAICTFWVSAYLLLKFNKTKRKYYFIQDYEPFFYVAGSSFALAESTYRFGFRSIVNTPGLLAAINQRHGTEGISFNPSVNREVYYPDPNKSNKKIRIFFYARPNNPRNAFSLGIATIHHLLEKYDDKIEIIAAGAKWNESMYGLEGRITNLGLIPSIQEVAALYRSCDIGFAYMMNKHPSYQMLEYAASGVATVMNYNEDHLWLYKDGENCLLSEPSPAAMAEKISLLIDDKKLREKIVKGANKTLNHTWKQQIDMIWNDILKT